MGLKQGGLRGSLRNVSTEADIIPDSVEYQFVAANGVDGGDWTSEDGSLTLSAVGSPTHQTDPNGNTIYSYDGTDDGHGPVSLSLTQPTGIVGVYRYVTTGQSKVRAIGATDPDDPYHFIAPRQNNSTYSIFAGTYLSGSTSLDTTWRIHSGYFDGANSETRIDGSTDGTGDTGTNDLNQLRVAYYDTDYTELEVAEFWILDNPSIQDIADSETILNDKYSVYGGSGNSNVFEDLNSVSYSTSYDVSSESTQITNVRLKDDGAKMWVSDFDNARVLEFDLSTAWDVTSASLGRTLDVSSEGTETQGIAWNGDGTKLYVPDLNSFVFEYDCSNAYDVSSATLNQSWEITQNGEDHVVDLCWSDDGSRCIIGAGQNDSIYEYSASIAYDISSLSFVQSYDVQNEIPNSKLKSVRIADGGSQMFITSMGADNTVYRYTLGSAYSLSSVTFEDSLDVSDQTGELKGADVRPDGSALYMTDDTDHYILQYE